ncbi:tetratricopeptide repeat protein [Calothrix sp. 336/3]|uniref:tetratricopeptide repeat protein n=1 Tax=Calothrix sp. 336/3 TaxID=1337936 RepID=UPI0004E412FE|nr:tetratricopeptide repeat protein [Calothrix sp. 336/3]AKG20558.1 hypothetical protein IJ00_03805 [Calothrix sp. 336/3]
MFKYHLITLGLLTATIAPFQTFSPAAAHAPQPLMLAEAKTSVEKLLESALAKSGANDYQGAIADITAVIKLEPKEADHYATRAAYYRMAENYKAAIADLTQGLQLNPENPIAYYYERATVKDFAGDVKGAIADMTAVIQVESAGSYYGLRADLYAKLGDHQKAVADFTQAIKVEKPELTGSLYVNRAASYVKLGNKVAALKDYQKAASLFTQPEEQSMREYTLQQAQKLK